MNLLITEGIPAPLIGRNGYEGAPMRLWPAGFHRSGTMRAIFDAGIALPAQ